jgi:pyrroline-5-carboxylate reductase
MNVGLIGAGHIARALAEGWSRPGERADRLDRLTVFDLVPDRAAALAADAGGAAADDVPGLVRVADVVIVAVRPSDVAGVLAEIGPLLRGRALVSLAAGVSLATLRACLPHGVAVGRVMPNVAAALGLGVFLFVPGTLGDAREQVATLFGSLGTVVEVAEEHFDAATAVAGCMPGYVARLAEAFARAGEAAGLAPGTARVLALDGLAGAAALVAAEGDPAAVVAAAATPGGMTAAGIAALDAHDIGGAVSAAVEAAAARAARLA